MRVVASSCRNSLLIAPFPLADNLRTQHCPCSRMPSYCHSSLSHGNFRLRLRLFNKQKEKNHPNPRYTLHNPDVKACSLRGPCPSRPIEPIHAFQLKTAYANDTANAVLNSQPNVL